jgi:Transposase DDE domain
LSDRACLTGILSTGPPAAVKLTDRELWSLVVQCARFLVAQTGPNPTGRAKLGSKCHLICDGRGVTFAIQLARANRNDSQQASSLVDAIPTLQGDRGCARRRPYCVLGDRRYDAEATSGMVKSLVCQPYILLTREPVRLGQEASQ